MTRKNKHQACTKSGGHWRRQEVISEATEKCAQILVRKIIFK
jgi:hypothetical protein